MNIKNFSDIFLSFIFTKRCRFCNKICNVTDEICEDCDKDLHKVEGEICYNCGVSKLLCNGSEKKHFYESICAPYYYDGAAKISVIHLKYKATERILNPLAEDMYNCVNHHYNNLQFDYCTYVPMHPDDEKKRGYNQAQLLAEKIAENMGIPCLPLLRKDFKTQSQHNLPQMKRSGNLLGAISFNTDYNTEIKGTRILLCDDIKTTGSTLDECTKTLLFEDCAEVRCVSACVSYNNAKRKD